MENTDELSLSAGLHKLVSTLRVKWASLHKPGFLTTCFCRKMGYEFKTYTLKDHRVMSWGFLAALEWNKWKIPKLI